MNEFTIFGSSARSHFEPPSWPRFPKSTTSTPKQKLAISIDDLCTSFQQSLNFNHESNCECRDTRTQQTPTTSWNSLRYSVLPAIWHPAAVRTTPTCQHLQFRSGNPPEYKTLPPHIQRAAFTKYRDQEGRIDVLASSYTQSPSIPQPQFGSSNSSSDSSTGCLTPLSSLDSLSEQLKQPISEVQHAFAAEYII